MTDNEIKKLAKEAGWPDSLIAPVVIIKLMDFARLVVKHERKRLDLCAECGSEEIRSRSQRNAADELEVSWQECDDCGHQWGHG